MDPKKIKKLTTDFITKLEEEVKEKPVATSAPSREMILSRIRGDVDAYAIYCANEKYHATAACYYNYADSLLRLLEAHDRAHITYDDTLKTRYEKALARKQEKNV